MSLKTLPPLLKTWTDADMEELTLDEALYLQMIFIKKRAIIDDRIERFAEFLVEDREKYQKIFNFSK
jgi:oligoribonuclease NrnB/cAMP/cGMP phosphodiesterase (DHH superfamily)